MENRKIEKWLKNITGRFFLDQVYFIYGGLLFDSIGQFVNRHHIWHCVTRPNKIILCIFIREYQSIVTNVSEYTKRVRVVYTIGGYIYN